MNQHLAAAAARAAKEAQQRPCARWRTGAHLYAPTVLIDPHGRLQNAAVCICGAVSARPTPAAHHIEITRQGLHPPPAQP